MNKLSDSRIRALLLCAVGTAAALLLLLPLELSAVPMADLSSSTNTASHYQVRPNTLLTYTIVVRNTGALATGVVVTDTPPVGTIPVTCSATSGTCYPNSSPIWTGDVGHDSPVTITYVVTTSNSPQNWPLINRAQIGPSVVVTAESILNPRFDVWLPAIYLTRTTGDGSGIVSDDFNSCDFSTRLWTFIDPYKDDPLGRATLATVGGYTPDARVSISIPAGADHDMWTGKYLVPRIMQRANNTNFAIEIKFDSPVSAQYQEQGVLIEQDSLNLLRFDFYSDGSKTHIFAASFIGGVATARANNIITHTNVAPLYMRVKRERDQWTQSYSYDGQNWTTAAGFNHPLTVTSVGTFVGSAASPDNDPPAHTGLIDYFFSTASPIVAEDRVRNTLAANANPAGSGTVIRYPDLPNYSCGQVVTLTPIASQGWTFIGWSGACSGAGTCQVTMSKAQNATAEFTLNTYLLTVRKAGTGSGTVTSDPSGINCGVFCSASYDYNRLVTLSAVAGPNSTFTGWSGACSGAGTCQVTMDSAKTVTATFTLNTFPLTVTKAGNGTVTSTPPGIDCGTTCSASYGYSTVVTLSAVADTGYTFTGWSGACSGTGSCAVTMDGAKTVTATFTLNTFPLTVTKAGNGTVTSTPPGIDCGTTCSASYGYSTLVTLSAGADTGYTFTGWSGACSGAGSCVVTMDGAKAVTATFTLNTHPLTVTKAGNGTVTSTPAGIDCGATCSASFSHGTVVTLSAIAGPGLTFTGWSGACSGTGTCQVTMDSAKTVTATFTLNTHPLTVTKAGSGTVTSTPAGIDCGTTCSASFDYSTVVTLSAVADTGYTFTGWSGACSGTGSCAVMMDGAKAVTATFTLNTYPLTVTKTGTGRGTVTSDPPGINCGATCSASFSHGTVVTLSAVARLGSTFAGWSGACSGTGSCAVTMDGAKTVTATFTLNTYPLTVTKAGNGTVTSTPAGIDCGATCSASYDYNTLVTLSAVADTGYTFTGWSGACSGAGSCTVRMNGARSVTATFTLNSYPLTVTKAGNGTVTSTPAGIDCGTTCSASYGYSTVVTLSAVADTGYTFTGWSGACSGAGTCQVTMDGAQSVTATFTLNGYPLTVTKAGNGTVTSTPAGIDCGATCSASYDYNTLVTLDAVADTGYTFAGWSGAAGVPGSAVGSDGHHHGDGERPQ